MAGTLLETKLHVPRRRHNVVSRARLLERLGPILDSRLTLISAPAGFGKTTLLADWIKASQGNDVCIAWLSLDEDDNHPDVYWPYVVAAVEKAHPGLATEAAAQLASPQPGPVEEILAILINELSASSRDIILVLDDYHVIANPEIHRQMTYLVEHGPPTLHLVIASRADPPLPLPRLRARGEVIEIRAVDLRFRGPEAAAYLNEAMGLGLTAADVESLEERTEGWIAALQLAALSIEGREDKARFVADFAGDDRYIVDYLLQEVLERQTSEIRDFLLETAILDRFSGALCDAVTGQTSGESTLRKLEEGNVFLVPLDDRRHWFRYHHLFADVLRVHLIKEKQGRVADLHRRASEWFEQNGEREEAVRHALAANDYDLAADLIEVSLTEWSRSRRETTLRAWLDALPADVLRHRPVLSAGYVGILLHSGELETIPSRLADAERYLESSVHTTRRQEAGPDAAFFVDEAEFRELPGMIALYRAGYAQVAGNLTDTAKYARLAIERMSEAQPLRGGAMALLGIALWSNGELEAAYETYAEGIALVHKGGFVNDSSTIMFADIRVAQGRLHDALTLYEQSIRRASSLGTAAPRGIADMHVGLSEIYCEQGELELAASHLTKSNEMGEAAGLPENRFRWFIAMSRLKMAQGDLDAALENLDEAERLYAPGFSPDIRPIHALRTRVWLAQGKLAESIRWVHDQRLSVNDELGFVREFQYLTLAKVLLEAYGRDQDAGAIRDAEGLLDRLLNAAESGGRRGSAIEALVLKALARQSRGDIAGAASHLERAIVFAEPEGYARVFLDQGLKLLPLFDRLPNGLATQYANKLRGRVPPSSTPAHDRNADYEPLSERELDVLRLLRSDLSGPDIARELVVSLNTMRTHTKNIYTKLGVSGRREALRRAEELHLL